MWGKIRQKIHKATDIMDLIMALVVIVAVAVGIFNLISEFLVYWDNRISVKALPEFFESVFNIVIGIEFIKMLCKPDADTIVEVLIFLVARHMIINQTSTVDDLISIISMCILFTMRTFLSNPKKWHSKKIKKVKTEEMEEEGELE